MDHLGGLVVIALVCRAGDPGPGENFSLKLFIFVMLLQHSVAIQS